MTNRQNCVLLFALADSQLWNRNDFIAWATKVGDVELLQELRDADDMLAILRGRLATTGTVLPESYGDLLGGLIWLRFEREQLSKDEAFTMLADAWDAYPPSRFDVEALASIPPELESHLARLAEIRIGQLDPNQAPEIARLLD